MRLKYTIGNIIDFCKCENIDYRELLLTDLNNKDKLIDKTIRLIQLGNYDKSLNYSEATQILDNEIKEKGIDIFDVYENCLRCLADSGFFIRGNIMERLSNMMIEGTPMEMMIKYQTSILAQVTKRQLGI